MLTKTAILPTLALLLSSCTGVADEDLAPLPPDPIGGELLRVEGTWAGGACARSHLYREGRALQYQCFDAEGVFSWENRATLTAAAVLGLDAALAAADLDDRQPVNHRGLCGASDAQGIVSMWIGERQVSFAPFCLFAGIVDLYEEVSASKADIAGCQAPFMRLASLEPGCRAY